MLPKFFSPADPAWQRYGFVTRATPRQLGRPPSQRCREWRRWALAQGGKDANQTRLYAVLQGRPRTAVAITSAQVEVADRREPPKGLFAYCPAGGAVGSPRLVDVDLNSGRVLLAPRGDDSPTRHKLCPTLSGTESEILEISAHTQRCTCSWRLRLRLVVNGTPSSATMMIGADPSRHPPARAASAANGLESHGGP